MFETFRSIRFHLLLAALGYIAVGAVMLFIPDQFLAVVCYVIGALLIAYGVIGMLMCWKDRTIRMAKIFIGILAIAVGIFVIAQPKAFTAVLPIIFGLILLLDRTQKVWRSGLSVGYHCRRHHGCARCDCSDTSVWNGKVHAAYHRRCTDLQRHFGFPRAVSHESCAIDL